MNNQIEKINKNIRFLKEEIINHPVYSVIKTIDDLKIFMQYHVYAVWDFMSLLKSLQNNLTCTRIPWFPIGNPNTRYLINEIVLGEESDVDSLGNKKSHFELYLEAMKQCGADFSKIQIFINTLQQTQDFDVAFHNAKTPNEAINFVKNTFNIIKSDKLHLQSAVFTFGREDLIPEMFLSIIEKLNQNFPDQISFFKYYIERHIEVDGDHHSKLAIEMTQSLCENNESYWNEVEMEVKNSLKHRIELWNGVFDEIVSKKQLK